MSDGHGLIAVMIAAFAFCLTIELSCTLAQQERQTVALQAIAASVGKPVSVSLVQPLKITLTDAAGIDCQALNDCRTDALNQKPEKRGKR